MNKSVVLVVLVVLVKCVVSQAHYPLYFLSDTGLDVYLVDPVKGGVKNFYERRGQGQIGDAWSIFINSSNIACYYVQLETAKMTFQYVNYNDGSVFQIPLSTVQDTFSVTSVYNPYLELMYGVNGSFLISVNPLNFHQTHDLNVKLPDVLLVGVQSRDFAVLQDYMQNFYYIYVPIPPSDSHKVKDTDYPCPRTGCAYVFTIDLMTNQLTYGVSVPYGSDYTFLWGSADGQSSLIALVASDSSQYFDIVSINPSNGQTSVVLSTTIESQLFSVAADQYFQLIYFVYFQATPYIVYTYDVGSKALSQVSIPVGLFDTAPNSLLVGTW